MGGIIAWDNLYYSTRTYLHETRKVKEECSNNKNLNIIQKKIVKKKELIISACTYFVKSVL